MKIFSSLAIVTLAMAATSVYAADNLKKTIEKMDKQVCAAMVKKDMKAFQTVTKPTVTSDFKYMENGQSMSYDQMVAQMSGSLMALKQITVARAKLISLKEKGAEATGTTTHHIEALMVMGKSKKPHKLVVDSQSTDTYKKVGKDWKMAVMNVTSSKMMLDGKLFDPMAGGAGK